MEKQQFIEKIKFIDREIIDLTHEGALYKYDFFRDLSSNPETYYDECITSLADPELTDQQKVIISLGIQKLPESSYHKLIKSALELLEEGKISNTVFKRLVFPGYSWNTSIQENYGSSKVKTIINTIIESPHVEESLKKYFSDYVLTGKAKDQLNRAY